MIFYEIFRWIGVITGYPFKWLFFKTKIYYENERATRRVKGGALVISNHFSPFDYVQNCFVFFPRKLWVVSTEEPFKNPIVRFAFSKFWGGIEANRTTMSMRFVSQSIKEIKKGHLVQIFPEGHNTDDGTIKEFYPSYLLIAHRAGAPIVPVVTDGNYGIFKRVHLMIGEPIELSDYLPERAKTAEVAAINETIRQKVLDLREELERRKAKVK
ncbi:MAG: 1-acyl-sn-glycerol-3-phosphate acyltransferase [Clostridia bacterium]|nr:1-acyl-sn-glycerol-3-phosphate acyltransferase [Clostridia bacterium]MBQ4601465.1 1-acyl-sn-glycerol-3-phosphate acyltransferase [Clostridia bacterium]